MPDAYRPTLYDFIAQEALKFYTSGEQAAAKPQDLGPELHALAKTALAGYKRPHWIEFVSELPKTSTGKIQRFKLRKS